MTGANIRELLARDLFEPFRLSLSSGESHIVRDPSLAVVMKSEVFIAHANSDRHTFIPLLHVAAVEKLGSNNGNGSHSRRRKRRR
jgi:hypothetical protein